MANQRINFSIPVSSTRATVDYCGRCGADVTGLRYHKCGSTVKQAHKRSADDNADKWQKKRRK